MGALFGKPKMPKEQPVTRMPIEDDKINAAEAERRRQGLAAQKGRDSTDLTPSANDSALGN